MTVFLQQLVACRCVFECCSYVCYGLHSNNQTKRHCARDNWQVPCVLPHCTFNPIVIIFMSFQQLYINSLFARPLMCGVIPVEETFAAAALPVCISPKSRKVFLTCPSSQTMWENSVPSDVLKVKFATGVTWIPGRAVWIFLHDC